MNPVTSGALISHYDGITGPFADTKDPAKTTPTATEKMMERWSFRVRSFVLGGEVLEGLKFVANAKQSKGKDQSVSYQVTDAVPGGKTPAPGELARILRPSETDFRKDQLHYVRGYADLRRDRAAEIYSQVDGFTEFFAGIGFLHPERTKYTLELLSAMLGACITTEMRLKHALACRRPVEYSAQLGATIQTPSHSTFPSGHACEAFLVAEVLSVLSERQDKKLYGSKRLLRRQLLRAAARIATNRIVAGVHFPVDNAVGQVFGTSLAKYLIARAEGAEAKVGGWFFDGTQYGDQDHEWIEIADALDSGDPGPTGRYLTPLPGFIIPAAPPAYPKDDLSPLNWLWEKARAEWRNVL
ncbi:MAG: phosphatase PAP2 family protein [Alphaproteobacteria bacterium]|nr:phosphatase PAP2 family protein [Alphaproteobacteria bacterium]